MKRHGEQQNISTNILSISKENYFRIKNKIEKFRDEIRSLVHKDEKPSDYVYQMNIQLFPSARIKKGVK